MVGKDGSLSLLVYKGANESKETQTSFKDIIIKDR